MFSFLAIANAFKRNSNTINILALSAIILLIINPYMIMYVGFQLSYIAVLGIIIWYPAVQKWINPSNKVLRLLWQITAISIVAQLATSPLSAFYFHRFPTYFFISNLIVIPAATMVVWGGLALLVFGSIASVFGLIFGSGLQMLIHAVNVSLKWITSLPLTDINDLAPSISDTFLLYGIIIFTFLYLMTGKTYFYRIVAGVLIIFGINLTYVNQQNNNLKQIVFYSVNNSWAIDFIENKKYTSITDSLLNLDQDKINYQITPYRRYHGLSSTNNSVERRMITDLGEITVWHGRKILLANPCIKPEAIPDHFDFVMFKVGQSGMECYQEQILLRKFVDDQGVGYIEHNLRSDGALIVDI
jgi:competence protein ComEC